ncbi:DUF4373 domain-containing protein [Bacteroides sp.]|uniref:DUF4373 domain-containing protein n=1 Tax=Bacteroides sp. TaxID=29523 RepID=UPI002FCC1DA8
MGRNKKIGLDYFPFDIDFFQDLKVRKLIKYQGGKAITVYALLLCNIYKQGYYMMWDEELPFIVSEQTGFEEAYIREVIKCCLVVGLFSKYLYESDKVLTSKGIQERYQKISDLCRRNSDISEYMLISSEEIDVSSEEKPINSAKSTQSKVKVKRKKNNIPPTPPKGGGDKPKRVSKKGKPAILNSSARSVFEDYYLNTFGSSYYWTAKDAGSMADLLKKISYSRTQKEMSVDDDSMLYALKMLLSSVKEGWIFENFSVTNINSKYNEIVAKAKNGNHNSGNKDGTGKPAGIKSHTF